MDSIKERALQALVESLDKEIDELGMALDKELNIRDFCFDALVVEIGPKQAYELVCKNGIPLKKYMEETYSIDQLGGVYIES